MKGCDNEWMNLGADVGANFKKNKDMQGPIKVHARVQGARALSRVRGVQGLLDAFSLKRAAGV